MSGNKTQRRIRHETEMFRTAMAAVFKSKNREELDKFLLENVLDNPHWKSLPAFRQKRVDAYLQGALDALHRVHVKTPIRPGAGQD